MGIANWLKTGLICGVCLGVLSILVFSGNIWKLLLFTIVSVTSSYILYKYNLSKMKTILLNFGLIFLVIGLPSLVIGFTYETNETISKTDGLTITHFSNPYFLYKSFPELAIFMLLGSVLIYSIFLTLFQHYYFKKDKESIDKILEEVKEAEN